MRMQASVRGEGTVQALLIGMLGKNGVVFLHCYATSEHFARRCRSLRSSPIHSSSQQGRPTIQPRRPSLLFRRQESSRSGFSWFGASRGGTVRWLDRRDDRRSRPRRPRPGAAVSPDPPRSNS